MTIEFAQKIAAGKVEMAVKLLAIRPDLGNKILFSLKSGLFRLAGFGEQDKMEMILKLYPQFFFEYASIKDISNVYPVIESEDSKGITVFQHALWAGDVRFMCNMMLDCLPKNAFGETIRIELLRQCTELMDKGVVYTVNGVERHEKQFSLQALITELDTYVENFNRWSLDEISFHWCNLGLPQNLLPAIIRHHYCNPEESFWDKIPNLSEQKKLIRTLYPRSDKLWDDSLIGLGSTFCFHFKRWARCGGWGEAASDSEALTALYNVGTQIDLPALMQRLQTPILRLDEEPEARSFDFS